VDEATVELVDRFHKMLEHYRAQRWDEADKILVELAQASPEPSSTSSSASASSTSATTRRIGVERRLDIQDQVSHPFGERIPQPGEALAVAEGVWWIRMPLPFALDHINLWVLEDGDGWTLVDTGLRRSRPRGHCGSGISTA
jgi:hypothetical protein